VKRLNNLEQTKKISNNKPLYAITKRYVGMREKEVPWEKKKVRLLLLCSNSRRHITFRRQQQQQQPVSVNYTI
jgi:hypothetical protein